MAHLHGDRAFGTGSGSSNQNLIGAGLDRDSGDSSGSGDARLSGTSRISAGSDLETFDENPELETRMRESGRNLASLGGGLENAPPVVLPGPVTSPLQFDGIVPNKDSLDVAARKRGQLKVLRTSNDSPVESFRKGGGGGGRCQCFRLPRRRRASLRDSDGEEVPSPTKV